MPLPQKGGDDLMTIYEIFGWLGMVTLIGSHFLVTHEIAGIHGKSLRFNLLAIAGAALIALSAAEKGNYPVIALEMIYGIISAHTLWAFQKEKTKGKK